MRGEVIAIVLAILVTASLGVGYLAGSSARGTQTITSTSTSITTVTVPFALGAKATAVDSSGTTGVDLVLAVNATTLKAGQSLNVQVSLFNIRPATNSVPTAKDWPFKGVPVALWYPCYFDTPAYAVVLKGNYSLQEVQRAANVTISFMCAEGASIDHVVFQ